MIVFDASVAAKWIFIEDYSEQADAVLRSTGGAGERIVSPPFLPIEITNIIQQRMRRERLSLPEAQERVAAFLTVPIVLEAPAWLHRRALELWAQYDLVAAYDSHYLALAEGPDCVLWTGDVRLLHALDGRLPFVHSIADCRSV